MIIEEQKVETYQKLGIFDKYYWQIEFSFLYTFYCSSLIKLFVKFDNRQSSIWCVSKDGKACKRAVSGLFRESLSQGGRFQSDTFEIDW